MKKALLFVWEVLKVAVIAFIIVVPIRAFVFQPFVVKGASMEPNYHTGDYLIVDEISYRFANPKRGDVIVFNYPKNIALHYIKRVIGLPGETVEISGGKITVFHPSGEKVSDIVLKESKYLGPGIETFEPGIETSGRYKITLGPKQYFVLGDNRPFSSDSRFWGPVPRKLITGKVLLRLWPLTALAEIKTPHY